MASDADLAAAAVERAFAGQAGVPGAEVATQSYRHDGAEALRHMFAVASSLDSQVIGEPQVLGQIKEAHRLSQVAAAVGGQLEAALPAAYAAARRVRRETGIAEQPVSIAAVVVDLAREIHGDLSRARGLLIGPGEIGELVIEQFRRAGLGGLTVAQGSPRRARADRQAYDADRLTWPSWPRGSPPPTWS